MLGSDHDSNLREIAKFSEKDAQASLDSAVTRGNRVLRDFERTAKQ